jgi:carboxypeptidase C (cathepsin A)
MLGLFTEQGPFKPDGNGTLQPNPYAWNRVANMIFVEQPGETQETRASWWYGLCCGLNLLSCFLCSVGVGFSYAEAGVDYVSGDRQAAKANYRGILAFFERFPHLKANELYLTSESYGGHYLPTLTAEILKQQQNATVKLNFKVCGLVAAPR